MAEFEPAATAFSAKNALLIASVAQAAYLDKPTVLARAAGPGLPNFRWIHPVTKLEELSR